MLQGLFSEYILPGLHALCNARKINRMHIVDMKNLKEETNDEEHRREPRCRSAHIHEGAQTERC